jgi:hypothetical protein
MVSRLYDGSAAPSPLMQALRAGRLTLMFDAGRLRYICIGEHELLRGIYAAVRDHNWATIPGSLSDVQIDAEADSFRIHFTSDHQSPGIHFVWRGEIVGANDNTLRFTFDGEALTSFMRNRVGFCVLHPADAAGKPVRIEHTSGSSEVGVFPTAISPHQPFTDICVMTYEATPGLYAETRMEGDTFETEDQRNWTDASFKTYCTPLSQPYPALIEAGTRIRQTIILSVRGALPEIKTSDTALRLSIDTSAAKPLPKIGLGTATHGEPLTALQIQRLKALHLAHIRYDLRFDGAGDWRGQLAQAWNEAHSVGAELELAAHLSANFIGELAQLQQSADTLGFRGTLLLFQKGVATQPETLAAARAAFSGYVHDLRIGGGTDAYFTELNRKRVSPHLTLDALAFSVNPQVHAFDKASLVETLPTLTTILDSTRLFAGETPLAVTPITLKPRWNPSATAADTPIQADVMPRQVDVRQMSLFGAGWTLGSIASLTGAASVTYFETTGWLGVMEREQGAPLPEQFPSISDGVYPMYHVFADMGDFAGGEALPAVSSAPLRFSGLVLRKDGKLRIMLANHTGEPLQITVEGVAGAFLVKALDEMSVEGALSRPEGYRAAHGHPITSDRYLPVHLLPYAVVTIDQTAS